MRKWLLHNLGLKLLSLALAVFLWIVVLGEQKVEVTVHVPLQLALPQDFFLANDPVDSLDIHLRGPKTLVTSLAPREVALSALPVKWVEGENLIPIRPDLVLVPRGIEVVEVTPQRVRVVLERAVDREVEIAPRTEGAPPEGYVVRRVVSVPTRIRMVGPISELTRITRVHTLPINLTGRTTSFSARVLLEPVGRRVQVRDGAMVTVEVEIRQKPS
jgi:YbbR domain-containing protein